MEPERFEAISRALAAGRSRRGLLAALAALVPVGAAAKGKGQGKGKEPGERTGKPKEPGGRAGKAAAPRAPAPRCTPNKACARWCAETFGANTAAASACASAAARCQADGPCAQCGPACGASCGKSRCGQRCVATATDPSNCGGCDKVCAADQACVGGKCACTAASCPGGCCDGAVCRLGTAKETCGGGGGACAACPGDQVCRNGACGFACGNGGGFCPAATEVCDDGDCRTCDVRAGGTATVQDGVDAAATGATVVVCAGTWPQAATVRVAKDLTLVGAGDGATVLDGRGAVRVLRVGPGATVTLRGLTVANGRAPVREFIDEKVVDGGDLGGGILNEGALTLVGVGVTGNFANVTGSGGGSGGGIYNSGALTLGAGSRVAGNDGGNNGGGVANAGTLTLQAGSRVTRNRAYVGGGIRNGGTATLRDGSLVTGNTASLGAGISSEGAVRRDATTTIEPRAAVCGNSGSPDCHNNLVAFSGTCPNLPGGTCPPA